MICFLSSLQIPGVYLQAKQPNNASNAKQDIPYQKTRNIAILILLIVLIKLMISAINALKNMFLRNKENNALFLLFRNVMMEMKNAQLKSSQTKALTSLQKK